MIGKAARSPQTEDTGRLDQTIGLYRIIAASTGLVAKAAVYAGMRRVETAEGPTVQAAFEAAAERVRARMEAHRRARTDGWPSAEEYRDAIEAAPLRGSERLCSLLRAHVARPDARSNWEDLAQVVGADAASVRLEYARLGRKLARGLGLPIDTSLGRELAPISTFALIEAPLLAGVVVQLRPQVAEALGEL